jgi:hypothetical protein
MRRVHGPNVRHPTEKLDFPLAEHAGIDGLLEGAWGEPEDVAGHGAAPAS